MVIFGFNVMSEDDRLIHRIFQEYCQRLEGMTAVDQRIKKLIIYRQGEVQDTLLHCYIVTLLHCYIVKLVASGLQLEAKG